MDSQPIDIFLLTWLNWGLVGMTGDFCWYTGGLIPSCELSDWCLVCNCCMCWARTCFMRSICCCSGDSLVPWSWESLDPCSWGCVGTNSFNNLDPCSCVSLEPGSWDSLGTISRGSLGDGKPPGATMWYANVRRQQIRQFFNILHNN